MRRSLCVAVIVGFVLGVFAQSPPTVVPANYRALVANAADPAKRTDMLAWGVLTVQSEAIAAQHDAAALRDQTGQTFQKANLAFQQMDQAVKNDGQQILGLQQSGADHEKRIKTLEQDVSPIVQHIQALEAQNLKTQLDAIQKQLSQFRSAACPALRNSKLKDAEKSEVEKVCQTDTPQAQ